jgi:hypothetical protein
MKTRYLLIGLSVAAAGVLAIIWMMTRPVQEQPQSAERRETRAVTIAESSTADVAPSNSAAPEPLPEPTAASGTPAAKSPPVAQGQQSKGEIQDPLARVALGLVGIDPDAEDYWLDAINDSSLSAHERQDLIEDLNEDGLSDPRRPGMEDLPLIVRRLQLIEEVAPYAMDQVNADAFQEAYKDLVNLYFGVTQR